MAAFVFFSKTGQPMTKIFGIPDNAPKPAKLSPAQKALHALIVHIDRQGWQDAKLAELVNAGREALKP